MEINTVFVDTNLILLLRCIFTTLAKSLSHVPFQADVPKYDSKQESY